MELLGIGLTITDFRISEFTYPENIQKRADQAAEYSMIGDMNRFQQVNMVDSMARGGRTGTAGSNATVGMQMGMAMAGQMAGPMNQMNNAATQAAGTGTAPKFCPNCGQPTNGAKFCGNCGTKLI